MEGRLCSALMCDNSLTYTISHQGLFGGPLYHHFNILNRIFANIVLKFIIIMRGYAVLDSIAVSLFEWSKQIQYKSSPNRVSDGKIKVNTETRCLVFAM